MLTIAIASESPTQVWHRLLESLQLALLLVLLAGTLLLVFSSTLE